MISVTLRFDYPDFDGITDENEIQELLMELPYDEILATAQNEGKPINMEVEVY